MAKKLSLVCFSGELDKLLFAFYLAAGASTVGYQVNMFFTFWGLNALKRNRERSFLGKSLLEKLVHFIMGGRFHLPLSRLHFFGIGKFFWIRKMKRRNVASLSDLMKASLAMGVKLYAFAMPMTMFGTSYSDLIPEVKDVIGVEKFLEYSQEGQILYI